MQEIPARYFSRYRGMLGFTSQQAAKDFFGARDISPSIDFEYASNLKNRISDVIVRVNTVICREVQLDDIETFCKQKVDHPYDTIVKHNLISRLNNLGRRPEQVLFSWLRGWASQCYFSSSIATVFGAGANSVRDIGQDDFTDPATFRRAPSADLEINVRGKPVRIEVQSGFQGVNDIKEHKVREARRLAIDHSIPTICAHFDLYNGQAAFVRLDTIVDEDINWVTRQQMEGQTVLQIDQNHFIWRLIEPPPDASALLDEAMDR